LGKILAALAVVVVIVESALTTIFQWRVYRMVFNNRSMKTVVMIIVSLTVVLSFNYDVFAMVMAEAVPDTTADRWSGVISTILSALIIAGGSSGVNTLLQRLGIRNPVAAAPEKPALREDEAWISVKANRVSAVGPIQIGIRELDDDLDTPPLAGTVGERPIGERLKEAFTADAMRFPNYGGRTVKPNKLYEIEVIGVRERQGADGTEKESFSKLVYKGGVAPRAIVAFTVDV